MCDLGGNQWCPRPAPTVDHPGRRCSSSVQLHHGFQDDENASEGTPGLALATGEGGSDPPPAAQRVFVGAHLAAPPSPPHAYVYSSGGRAHHHHWHTQVLRAIQRSRPLVGPQTYLIYMPWRRWHGRLDGMNGINNGLNHHVGKGPCVGTAFMLMRQLWRLLRAAGWTGGLPAEQHGKVGRGGGLGRAGGTPTKSTPSEGLTTLLRLPPPPCMPACCTAAAAGCLQAVLASALVSSAPASSAARVGVPLPPPRAKAARPAAAAVEQQGHSNIVCLPVLQHVPGATASGNEGVRGGLGGGNRVVRWGACVRANVMHWSPCRFPCAG